MIAPRYGAGTLADVIPGALAALGLPGVADPLRLADRLSGKRRVAVLLVDGLGHHQLPLAAPYVPTLGAFGGGPITCGFPSTTPTSLVSAGTGAPPGAHGVLAFNVRVPETGRVLNHIEWRADPDPAEWQPVPTLFARAEAAGIPATVVSRPEFAGSGLTIAAYGGGGYLPATGVDGLAEGILAALRDRGGLVYGYHPDLDKAGHLHGLRSPEWAAAAGQLDRLLSRLVDGLPADAALLVTADHGQLDVPLEGRTDIDLDPRLRAGVVAVAGEPRVRYLHTLDGARDDVLATWRGLLGEAAWVGGREEAAASGWFGPVPPAHLARLGDVVVVCGGTHVVVASRTEPAFVAKMIAFHGSYTPAEMEIPLLILS